MATNTPVTLGEERQRAYLNKTARDSEADRSWRNLAYEPRNKLTLQWRPPSCVSGLFTLYKAVGEGGRAGEREAKSVPNLKSAFGGEAARASQEVKHDCTEGPSA